MIPSRGSLAGLLAGMAIALCVLLTGGAARAGSPQLDQAVWLGLTGRFAAAESLLTLCLANEADREAARNNLGNIHLLRGDMDLARACYNAVLEVAPREAGTILNRALLEHLSGDTISATRDALAGLSLAGGEEAAAALLGVSHQVEEPVERQRQGIRISSARVRELLALARRAVPMDSLHPGPLAPTTSRPTRPAVRPPSLTTSGARGGVEEARVLYWKYGTD